MIRRIRRAIEFRIFVVLWALLMRAQGRRSIIELRRKWSR